MRRITIREAADLAGLQPRALQRAAGRGRLRVERISPRVYLTTAAWLDDYLTTRHRGNFRKPKPGHA